VHGSEAECCVPSAGLGRYSCVAFGPVSVDSTADKADYMHGDAAGSGLQQSLATDAEARIGVHESTPEELGAPNNDASRLIVAQSCAVEELYGMVARLLDMQAISAEEQVRGLTAWPLWLRIHQYARTVVRDRTAKQCYTRPRLRITQCG
jgi:hypothetical protein